MWAVTRKVKPNWILLKQETVSGSGIRWAICVCTLLQTDSHTGTHHSVFYRPDALPATQPTASKHWRNNSPGQRAVKRVCVCVFFFRIFVSFCIFHLLTFVLLLVTQNCCCFSCVIVSCYRIRQHKFRQLWTGVVFAPESSWYKVCYHLLLLLALVSFWC